MYWVKFQDLFKTKLSTDFLFFSVSQLLIQGDLVDYGIESHIQVTSEQTSIVSFIEFFLCDDLKKRSNSIEQSVFIELIV